MNSKCKQPVLPDVLKPNLDVVFCGMAAGPLSAALGAYYAHPQNKFWPTLYAVGLTPNLVAPSQFASVFLYGIGLTDLVKHSSGVDKDIMVMQEDRVALAAKIEKHKPYVVAFNGKKLAQKALGNAQVQFGLQTKKIENCLVYVLPSTSPANGHWKRLSPHWSQLAEMVKKRQELREL